MRDRSREVWCRDYMSMMDDEYDGLGFADESDPYTAAEMDDSEILYPITEYDESSEGFGFGSVWPEDLKEERLPGRQGLKDDSASALPGFIKLRDIELPDTGTDKVKKLKRDIRMEALRRIEDAARTVADFKVVLEWYDALEYNEKKRVSDHELYRSGDDLPLEYGAVEDGTVFPAYLGDVISRQLRKGDFLDYLYCRPETIDQLTTTDYLIHFMRAIKPEERELFFYRAIEGMSAADIADMKGQTDRTIRFAWKKLITHLKQRTMGVLIFRSDKDYSYTGQELEFLNTCREKYEIRVGSEAGS